MLAHLLRAAMSLLAGLAMSKSNNKDGAKDRNGRHEQHQDTDVEISHEVCVMR